MGKEQLPRGCFIKACWTAGISLVIWGIDQTLFSEEISQTAEDLILGALNYKAGGFKSFPSIENCINRRRAFWIVHKGYLAKQGYLKGDDPDYLTYWQNITRLSEYLKQSGEPTFLVIEDRNYQRGGFRQEPIPSCISLVVTRNMEGSLKRYVHTETGIREQSVTGIKEFLDKNGITTLCFAGEQAYHGIQSDIGTGGCLWEVAKLFADSGSKIDIKGIEGCVYPLNPPKNPNNVLKELYFDTIPIPGS